MMWHLRLGDNGRVGMVIVMYRTRLKCHEVNERYMPKVQPRGETKNCIDLIKQ